MVGESSHCDSSPRRSRAVRMAKRTDLSRAVDKGNWTVRGSSAPHSKSRRRSGEGYRVVGHLGLFRRNNHDGVQTGSTDVCERGSSERITNCKCGTGKRRMREGKRKVKGRTGRLSGTKGERKTITQDSGIWEVKNGGRMPKEHGPVQRRKGRPIAGEG